jgi:hypothetical protein
MALIGIVALAAAMLYLLDRLLIWCGSRGWIRYRRSQRRFTLRGHVGPGAGGAIYDMLNQDRRQALEVIAEERAGARDPEDRDEIIEPEPPREG